MEDKHELLRKYFGYTSFRDGQEPVIDALLEGRDTLGVMPTGAGKSLCFQVPALLLPGITLVVSPLISLMKDQVTALIQSGIPAAFINSALTPGQIRKALGFAAQGKDKIIYVAPERLLTQEFLSFSREADIPFLAVDEAHCVSQWGQDFRPSYLKVGEFLDALPRRPVVGAFTATATAQVREDIVELLGLRDPQVVFTGYNRENLYFEVQSPRDKFHALCAFLDSRRDKSGIVYCLTRKTVEKVHSRLVELGYPATRYHAGLEADERRENQELFQDDQLPLMVATNAFGMGIDKSNVAFVVHFNMPKNPEAYYQEAGRAGRDGSPAECLLFYSGQDVVTNQYFIDNARENEEMDPQSFALFQRQEKERLKRMTFYCHTKDCLRGYLLDYFGDKSGGYCGNCFNCLHHYEEVEVGREAREILSCVKQTGERYGVKMVCDVLRGVATEKAERLGFPSLAAFGSLKDTGESRIREILQHLLALGFLESAGDPYPVLRLRDGGLAFLAGAEPLTMNILKEEAPVAKSPASPKNKAAADPRLYAKLQALRSRMAKQQSVPAYVIFSDSALRHMCTQLPTSPEAFLQVNGVGQVKLERYGEAFLQVIREHLESRSEQNAASRAESSPAEGPGREEELPSPAETLAKLYQSKLVTKGFGGSYQPWTGEEDDILREKWSQGCPPEEIGQALGRAPGAVSSRLKSLGLT